MKRFLLLFALCALALTSCKKGTNIIYTVAAEDITPCTVKIVARVSQPEAFTMPLMIVYLSPSPNLHSQAVTPSKLSTSKIKDGEMTVFYPYLKPEMAYYFWVRVIQDGVNYDSPDFGFVTPDLPTGVIDMGLSVKWASTNLGASALEEKGDLFAWGEVAEKTDFTWETYKWCQGSEGTLTKYCEADGKKVLDPEDDAAHVILGGNWRMPTAKEYRELHRNCTQSSTIEYKGTMGVTFTSNINGNTLFFPMRDAPTYDGRHTYKKGHCWTSSLDGNTGGYNDPYYPLVWEKGITQEITNKIPLELEMEYRYEAAFIRPVLAE